MNITLETLACLIAVPTMTISPADIPAPDENNIITLPYLCKAAELDRGETVGGVLEVLPEQNDAGKFYGMPLEPGPTGRNSCVFKHIRTTNTTVDLAKVTLFPL